MRPRPIHEQLHDFIETIKNDAIDVSIEKRSTQLFDRFMTDQQYQERFAKILSDSLHKVASSKNLVINADQEIAFSTFSSYVRWRKVDRTEGTGPMYGGFAFHLGESMVLWTTNKWKKGYADFLEYADENPADTELLDQLTWFESPTPVVGSLYTPYYGCVLPNDETFPHDFFFFDGGILYPLPFQTYEAYIAALLANAGVECWQYFYVDPVLLVQRNRGLSYMTTDLRIRTSLAEKIDPFVFNPSYTFDRLDLIVEYLRRCVRILPDAFPMIDFGHQEAYLKRLSNRL